MDRQVLDAMARWPQVPAVYGWLALDRRGNWLLRESEGGRLGRIGNAALREFIGRNYAADERGCWYFQNGPQRVFVELAYTPWVLHYEGEALLDQCGAPASPGEAYVDEEGSVLLRTLRGAALLDDRDLAEFAARLGVDWRALPRLARAQTEAHFGFVRIPADSLR
jgi:hypothetical protein